MFIMIMISFSVIGITSFILYRNYIDETKEQLRFSARNQANIIESIGRFNKEHQKRWHPDVGVPDETTLKQIKDAYTDYHGMGKTGEIVIARREGDRILFLLRTRNSMSISSPEDLSFASKLADPMKRALTGLSGDMIGVDYDGDTVLAAYEPIQGLNWGVVDKIDMREVRAPFFRAGAAALGVSFLSLLLRAYCCSSESGIP